MILEDYIEQNAILYPNKTAIVCNHETCSYKELFHRVNCRVEELKGKVCQGSIKCMRAASTIDFLVSYFALHKLGVAAAPMEYDMSEESFERVAKEMTRYSVPEGTADILYTTGTTGKSKGVIISHKTIIADAENLIDRMGFSHELAFVINGPLNHIGSLSKIYPNIMLGATIILVDGLKDLNKFFEAFDFPASKMATFLVPASIRRTAIFFIKKNGFH